MKQVVVILIVCLVVCALVLDVNGKCMMLPKCYLSSHLSYSHMCR